MTPIWARLRAVAEAAPDAPALEFAGGCTSYAALRTWAEALGLALRDAGLSPGARVGLHLDATPAYVAALLACWSQGLVAVPLSPDLPAPRLRFMAADADLALVITEAAQADPLPHLPSLSPGLAPPGAASTAHAAAPLPADHPAYVIYTSGSTGRPKGVLVGHAGLVPLLDAQIAAFGLSARSRGLLLLSLGFDASLSDIGTVLLAGGCLCLSPPASGEAALARLAPAALAGRLRDLRVTHLDLPPALLRRITPAQLPPCLTTLIIGGEVCPPEVVRAHAARRRVVNVYGPTEATICVSLCRCDAERWREPLLGQALPGVALRVVALDSDAEAPPGAPGELWIAGPALALCYLNQPELTAQRFVLRDGQRWYRSGDLVRRKVDGSADLEFLGRVDRQLKLHGRLVAPEEIEAALQRQPEVRRAAVLRGSADPASAHLVAYVEPEHDHDPALGPLLRARLAQELPPWLVPARIVIQSRLPQTPAGKVDLAALAAPPAGEHRFGCAEGDRSAPPAAEPAADPTLAVLCALCARALNHEVSQTDDLLSRGLTSLAALEIAAAAEALGLTLLPSQLLALRTPAAVARALTERDHDARSLPSLQRDASAVLHDPALAAPPAARGEPITPPPVRSAHLLLTGATGLLGAHLLAALLADDRTYVTCLVRAADPAQARHRLGAALLQRGVTLAPAAWARVQVLPGDLSAPLLGLSPSTWRTLASTCTEVHHLAADLNAALPYAALRATNLEGTARVLQLCAPARLPLHHASTLSVQLAASPDLHGGYAQSKAAAEALLALAPPDQPRWCHRLGLLTAPLAQLLGPAPPSDPVLTFLRGLRWLGCVPPDLDLDLRVDLTPVDWAAAALLKARHTDPQTHVIAAPYGGASLGELLALLRARGPLPQVSLSAFRARLPAVSSSGGRAALGAYLALCAARPSNRPLPARPGALFLTHQLPAPTIDLPAPPREQLLDAYLRTACTAATT